MASPLEDLDELTLRCRDDRARQYISEAVASYRAGAFCSAIVATWIAVCFDVIEKLRELSLAGDKEAEKQVQELDATRRTGDLTRALKFERELLDVAKDKFELISPLEFIDLERLQADRNRCAHPSLTSEDKAYSPSAELARLHLHSAVTHLLQHPPVQGKYALDRLTQEIDSDYFPSSAKEAKVAFASGPLRRPRESLVRNLVVILIKALLKDKPDYKRRSRLTAALAAVRELHPTVSSATLSEKLSPLVRAVPDKELPHVTAFLEHVKDCWHHLQPDVHQRLENYVKDLPSADLESVDFLLTYPPLQSKAKDRVSRATKKELTDAMFWDTPPEVVDRILDLYLASDSFDDANSWAKQVVANAGDFRPDHIRRLLTSAAKNSQVTGSFQFPALLASLRAKKKLPEADFEQMLRDNGLKEFALGA